MTKKQIISDYIYMFSVALISGTLTFLILTTIHKKDVKIEKLEKCIFTEFKTEGCLKVKQDIKDNYVIKLTYSE